MNGLKRAALLAEDGATFHGSIDSVDNGQFRAACRAELDRRSHYEVEETQYQMCASRDEARRWIHGVAAARGFKVVVMQPD